jgi:hypothetical protein
MGSTRVELVVDLGDWVSDLIGDLRCGRDTKAYVISVLAKDVGPDTDMSKMSLVLAYEEARRTANFVVYQQIGDWVLWVSSVHPGAISENQEVVQTVGRLSYSACNRMLRGSWPLYEELADNLPVIAREINHRFQRDVMSKQQK